MAKQLEKVYDPKQVEDRTYRFWMEKNYFHADAESKKEPYTIVIPPPNITGQLHMGHALDNTLQDALIRWRRMQGYEALWLPGTDHASIATEAKIVEAMRQEGVTKEQIGREGFLERAWEWKRQYGGRIVEQLKKLPQHFFNLPRIGAVKRRAVAPCDGCDVFGLFHPAFDFYAGNPCFFQLIQFRKHADVVWRKAVIVPAGSSRNGSALAAGLSAGASVTAAFACHGGIQAASRKAHAECAVGKGLYLDTAVFRKVFNHIEADLTGKHGTLKAKALEPAHLPGCAGVALCACVKAYM